MDVLCNTGMLLFVEQFLFLQVCQQPFRSIFNQVKYGFETIDTAIVGIRHIGFTAVSSKLQKHVQPVFMACRADGFELIMIVAVHCDYKVKLFKVTAAYPACTLWAEIDTALESRLLCTRVRRVADMVCNGAG